MLSFYFVILFVNIFNKLDSIILYLEFYFICVMLSYYIVVLFVNIFKILNVYLKTSIWICILKQINNNRISNRIS